jgi:hypothetical protein
MKNEKQKVIRLLVKTRDDFQGMRKCMGNRIGITSDGEPQDLKDPNRALGLDDLELLKGYYDNALGIEKQIEKEIEKRLKTIPIYTQFLKGVKGVGTIAAGWIIGEIDIERATTVSKIWQFCGLNPGTVRGTKSVCTKDYKPEMGEVVGKLTDFKDGKERLSVKTSDMIRGDKLTPGYLSPYNQRFRAALVGVLASGFIKAKSEYAVEYYYPYKTRLENSENKVNGKPWNEESKGHRDMAAKRYMIKMFLKDLYVAWRTLEGLAVREPYMEEFLGKRHIA